MVDASGNLGFYYPYSGYYYLTGYNTNSLSANWHNITTVSTAGQTKFYVDGTFVGAASIQVTQPIVAVGNDSYYQYRPIGSLDEFAVFNRALSTQEIAQMSSIKLSGNETGLMVLYSFEDSSSLGKDSSPNHLNGTTDSVGTVANNTQL